MKKLRSVLAAGTGRRWVSGRIQAGTLLAGLAVAPLLRRLIVADSVPAGTPRRLACASCAAPLRLDCQLRAFSPLARCGGCGERIGPRAFTVELALIGAVAVLVTIDFSPVEVLAIGWWLACAVPLAFIDVAVHRLPDRLTGAAVAGVAGLLSLAVLIGGHGTAWLWAAGAGLGLALLFATSTVLLGERGFGLGDAKLALSAGALLGWLGWPVLLAGIFATFVGSALASLVLLASDRIQWNSHLPFGPFLIAGTTAAVLVSG